MPVATLKIPVTADQARTARLVAGAAARRASVDPEAIDDVRLAVAEAVGRAVFHADTNPDGTVRMTLQDDAEHFEISITDGQPINVDDEEGELALSLIRALSPQAKVGGTSPAQSLVLRWPVEDSQ